MRHRAIRGNVETEIARVNDIGAGCGCAYPASVGDDMVRRSNEIAIDLRRTTQQCPGAVERMAALPMAAQVDLFASSHTCPTSRMLDRVTRAGRKTLAGA